jgi:hypothetical protein
MGLLFTIAAGPRQRSHSQVRFRRNTRPHFTVSNSRLPQPVGPGPRIYIFQEVGSPAIYPGTVFPFYSRVAGLRWRYSTPPPYSSLALLITILATARVENTASIIDVFPFCRGLPSVRIHILPFLTKSVRVRVTLRLKVSQSVCIGIEPRPGLMTRY